MTTVTLNEALVRLAELLELLNSGETVEITENDRTVARLVPPDQAPKNGHNMRGMGSLKGTVTHMAEDFDEPLPEFREYM